MVGDCQMWAIRKSLLYWSLQQTGVSVYMCCCIWVCQHSTFWICFFLHFFTSHGPYPKTPWAPSMLQHAPGITRPWTSSPTTQSMQKQSWSIQTSLWWDTAAASIATCCGLIMRNLPWVLRFQVDDDSYITFMGVAILKQTLGKRARLWDPVQCNDLIEMSIMSAACAEVARNPFRDSFPYKSGASEAVCKKPASHGDCPGRWW